MSSSQTHRKGAMSSSKTPTPQHDDPGTGPRMRRRQPPEPLPTEFSGFSAAGLAFLREIAERQDRDWFTAHKADYEREVRAPLAALLIHTSEACIAAGLPLKGDAKRSIFRLHRDVRFSADKRPFQTHASAVLSQTGDKRSPGVLYMHVEPERSFAAVGFYGPDTFQLRALRDGIADDPAGWGKMIGQLAGAGYALDASDALLRSPRGFEQAAPEVRNALRLRSLVVMRPLAAEDVKSKKLPDVLAQFALDAAPLLNFGWACLGQDPAAMAKGKSASQGSGR